MHSNGRCGALQGRTRKGYAVPVSATLAGWAVPAYSNQGSSPGTVAGPDGSVDVASRRRVRARSLGRADGLGGARAVCPAWPRSCPRQARIVSLGTRHQPGPGPVVCARLRRRASRDAASRASGLDARACRTASRFAVSIDAAAAEPGACTIRPRSRPGTRLVRDRERGRRRTTAAVGCAKDHVTVRRALVSGCVP